MRTRKDVIQHIKSETGVDCVIEKTQYGYELDFGYSVFIVVSRVSDFSILIDKILNDINRIVRARQKRNTLKAT